MSVQVTPRDPSRTAYTVSSGASLAQADGGSVIIKDAEGNLVGLVAQADNDVVLQ